MWFPQFWMQKIKTLCIKNANIGNYFEITAKMSFFSHYRNINTTQSSLTYLKIIQKGLKELDYNVNYKLWLDSMFAKLIGGGSND